MARLQLGTAPGRSSDSVRFSDVSTNLPFLDETFTGTNGAAWGPNWTAVKTPTAPSGATIQSNRGRIVTDNVGSYADITVQRVADAVIPSTTTDSEQLVSFIFSASNSMYAYLYARGAGTTSLTSAYQIVISPVDWTLQKTVAGTASTLTTGTQTFTAGTKYWMRLRVQGNEISAKWWADGTTEPTDWNTHARDTSLTSGFIGIGVTGGSSAVTGGTYIDFDDYQAWIPGRNQSAQADVTGRGLDRDTGARRWIMRTRDALTAFAVPFLRPASGPMAFDVMPAAGAAEVNGEGYAWFDACDTDCGDNDPAVGTARLGIKSDRVEIGSKTFAGTNPVQAAPAAKPVYVIVGSSTAVAAIAETNLNWHLPNTAWNTGHLQLGSYHLWIDASGRLRIKSSAPTSDTDGTVVGTQA